MHLITLLGQTCSGKSQMAVDLAKLLEKSAVVNCDSRQVYKGLNIGTGKVEGRWKNGIFMYKDVPHYLIDYADPIKRFTLATYVQDFINLIDSFDSKIEFVIVTGGTGLYATAVTEKYNLGLIKPEFTDQFEGLKRELNKKSLEVLQSQYLQLNSKILHPLNSSDFHNPRRLIPKIADTICRNNNWNEDLIYPEFKSISNFTIEVDQEKLKEKIRIRLTDRVNQGLLDEVKNIQYLGRQRLLDLGLEYRLTQFFLEGHMDQTQWLEGMYTKNIQYAKRQLTWLKKHHAKWVISVEDVIKKLLL